MMRLWLEAQGYEADKEMPNAAFFTAVNSKYKDVCTLDWIITGKG